MAKFSKVKAANFNAYWNNVVQADLKEVQEVPALIKSILRIL
jgi:hypothetical protein